MRPKVCQYKLIRCACIGYKYDYLKETCDGDKSKLEN